MTLLGKIFTVLVLVMSILFMSFSIVVYATHRNWKLVVDNATPTAEHPLGLRQQVTQQRETNEQLRGELERAKDALAAEQAARRFALASLRTKLDDATQKRIEKEKELAELQASHRTLVTAHDSAVSELGKATREVERLRDEYRQTREDRDEQFAEVVRLTDELNRLEGTRRSLEERRAQLLAQNSAMKAVLTANGLTEFDNIDQLPPDLDGIVVAVSDKDLIEISIGSDDGLKEGHVLDVFRQNAYLGRVIIRRTAPDRAVAEIIKEYRRGVIKKGDRVATKLS